jgi:hypothetical protein
VAHNFPFPLALTYERAHAALDRQQAVEAVWAVRDAVECYVKFAAVLAAAALLAGEPAAADAGAMVDLLFHYRGLAIGSWVEILEASLRPLQAFARERRLADSPRRLPGLFTVFFREGQHNLTRQPAWRTVHGSWPASSGLPNIESGFLERVANLLSPALDQPLQNALPDGLRGAPGASGGDTNHDSGTGGGGGGGSRGGAGQKDSGMGGGAAIQPPLGPSTNPTANSVAQAGSTTAGGVRPQQSGSGPDAPAALQLQPAGQRRRHGRCCGADHGHSSQPFLCAGDKQPSSHGGDGQAEPASRFRQGAAGVRADWDRPTAARSAVQQAINWIAGINVIAVRRSPPFNELLVGLLLKPDRRAGSGRPGTGSSAWRMPPPAGSHGPCRERSRSPG